MNAGRCFVVVCCWPGNTRTGTGTGNGMCSLTGSPLLLGVHAGAENWVKSSRESLAAVQLVNSSVRVEEEEVGAITPLYLSLSSYRIVSYCGTASPAAASSCSTSSRGVSAVLLWVVVLIHSTPSVIWWCKIAPSVQYTGQLCSAVKSNPPFHPDSYSVSGLWRKN